jgi:hypothetical protein
MNEWGTYFCERAEVSVMNEWRGSKKYVMYTVKDVRASAAVLHFCGCSSLLRFLLVRGHEGQTSFMGKQKASNDYVIMSTQ